MRIILNAHERETCELAMELHETELAKSKKLRVKLALDTMAEQQAEGLIGTIREAIDDAKNDLGECDAPLTQPQRHGLWFALSLLKALIEKRRDKDQEELGVDVDDFNKRLLTVERIRDRVHDQLQLFEEGARA